jgi:ABC-type glycerol-3-phosphate transport system substrate-binding protein
MSDKKFSRRSFLKVVGVTGASVALAACGTKATTAPTAVPTTVVEPTKAPPVAETKPIAFLCRTDIKSAYAADVAVKNWNAAFPSQVTMDEPPQGDITTKIQSAQAAGDLVWDGYAVMETPWSTADWVSRGLIAPLDNNIKVSTVKNADKVILSIIPTIKEAASYGGKLYGIPGNCGSVNLAWYWEPVKNAGFEDKFKNQPVTWDDVYQAAKAIKKSNPEYTPFSFASLNLCLLYAMIWSAKDEPLDADGIIDIRSDESLNALEWCRKLVDEELMPGTDVDQFGNWLKKGIAIISCFDVAGTMAQQTFGMDAATTGINFFPDKSSTHAGCPFWINSSVLLDKAKNPQGMVDFFLWWFGPDNKDTGKQIATVAAKPCYSYTYDEFIKGNADLAWEQPAIDLVAKSKWFPANRAWSIETVKVLPYLQKLLDVNNTFSRDIAKQEMANAYTEIKNEIALLK